MERGRRGSCRDYPGDHRQAVAIPADIGDPLAIRFLYREASNTVEAPRLSAANAGMTGGVIRLDVQTP